MEIEKSDKEEETKLTEEEKKYVKVYPIYIDKGIKYSKGRKINAELCVENPNSMDIQRVCNKLLGLKCKLEYKSHPKDWEKRGRVIVQIKDNEGKLIKEEIKSSKLNIFLFLIKLERILLKTIAENIPKLKEAEPPKEDTKKAKRRKKKK